MLKFSFLKKFDKAFDKIKNIKQRVEAAVTFSIEDYANNVLDAAEKNAIRHSKSGDFAEAVGLGSYTAKKNADKYFVTFFIDHPAARILDKGGTITPKEKDWLTVPTDFARDSTGKISQSALDVKKEGTPEYKASFIFPRRMQDGDMIMTRYSALGGSRTRPVPIWVLKKEVEIKGFKYMTKAVESAKDNLNDYLKNRINIEIKTN